MKKVTRNGKVELLRFIFGMIVLLFHINKYIVVPAGVEGSRLFPYGAIGVEFFFILTGFFMAASAYKKSKLDASYDLGEETVVFMKRKYMSIFPYHIIAFVILFTEQMIVNRATLLEVFIYFLKGLPNIFLVQMSGITLYSPNHIEWYISAMLIALMIVYPLIRKNYSNFVNIIAPLGSLILIGLLMNNGGALTGVAGWMGIAYRGTLRAIAEVSLGAVMYEVTRKFNEKEYTKKASITLRVMEIIVYLGLIGFTVFNSSKHRGLEVVALAFVCVGIVLSNLKATEYKFLNNGFVCYLGKLSLGTYVIQLATIDFALLLDVSVKMRVIIATALTIVLGMLVMFLGDVIMKKLTNKSQVVVAKEKQ